MAVRYDRSRRQAISESDAIPAHREAAPDPFDEQSDGKTVITLRQLHPTKAQRDAGIGFGAVEFGYQTLEKLAQHVERSNAT